STILPSLSGYASTITRLVPARNTGFCPCGCVVWPLAVVWLPVAVCGDGEAASQPPARSMRADAVAAQRRERIESSIALLDAEANDLRLLRRSGPDGHFDDVIGGRERAEQHVGCQNLEAVLLALRQIHGNRERLAVPSEQSRDALVERLQFGPLDV